MRLPFYGVQAFRVFYTTNIPLRELLSRCESPEELNKKKKLQQQFVDNLQQHKKEIQKKKKSSARKRM